MTEEQDAIIKSPLDSKIFLHGMAGVGKTTTGVGRLRHLLESGVPAHSILVVVPQKRLGMPYREEARNPIRQAGAEVTIATLGGLAQQMVRLFWPLITNKLSPVYPTRKPKFLMLEMVQYLMFKLLDPEIERSDFFNSVKISRARLFGQIADNLNKSALIGFPYTGIAQRLKAALPDDAERLHIFDDAQACATLFREYCVKYNLLDFSLQVALFSEHLWGLASPRAHLIERYQHLIADNIEEDTPATHRLLRELLPACRSALLIYDEDAGYRRFLGADDVSALSLKELCERSATLDASLVMSEPVEALLAELREVMRDEPESETPVARSAARHAIAHTSAIQSRFHTQMLDWVADRISQLIQEEGAKPSEIVILSPLLNDSLRFALTARLKSRGVPAYTLRPSRPLHSEPAVRALITLAKLAHPQWRPQSQMDGKRQVKKFDVVQMLLTVIGEIDLARATLLAEVLFKQGRLNPFSGITNSEMRSRITEVFGERFERLRSWIDAYQSSSTDPLDPADPIDVFFRRLFGEVMSQRGFGFHGPFDAVRVIANLIDSARSFRQSVEQIESNVEIGAEYVKMVDDGILADQYEPPEWKQHPDAVLIAPAYTFLLSNQAVDYQFWINLDSQAWARRLHQPLTQPYVLSLQWNPGAIWTDADEQRTSREMLSRVVSGLVKRCRSKIFLGFSKFDERGNEQIGELRNIFDFLLRSLPADHAD